MRGAESGWDLRVGRRRGSMALPLLDALRLAVAAVSAFVFVVGVVAYRRRPSGRMLLVVALFAAFLAQGVLLAIEVLVADTVLAETLYYGFQLLELLLVAAILLKR